METTLIKIIDIHPSEDGDHPEIDVDIYPSEDGDHP